MKHREGPTPGLKRSTQEDEALIRAQGRAGSKLRTVPTGLGILGTLEYWGTEKAFSEQREELRKIFEEGGKTSVMAKSRQEGSGAPGVGGEAWGVET